MYKAEILADSLSLNIGKKKNGFPAENLTNLIFGKFKVLSYEGNSKWKCECSCKNIRIVRTADLKNGNSKSCRNCSNRLKNKGETGFNKLYSKYKKRAETYNRVFNLTKNDFKIITSSNCHYCGSKPEKSSFTTKNNVSKQTLIYSKYLYNGVDRIDSSKGYTIDNVVPCCEICNKAKRDMPYENFLNWINKLINFKKNE